MVRRAFAITTFHTSHSNKAVEAAEEWKKLGICAIGWSKVPHLCKCESKDEVVDKLRKYGYSSYGAEDVWKFVGEMKKDDLVFAYSRDNTIAYVGTIVGPCEYNTSNIIGDPDGDFGYAYQRKVQWWDEPHHFDRRDLPNYFAKQFGKKGITVAEIDVGSKGIEGLIKILKTCAISGSKFPGINEDLVKAGLLKYLHHSIDALEKGLKLKNAEVAIGKKRKSRPDFIAEDINGQTVLIECKGIAEEGAIDQIERYRKEYGKNCRLLLVAFRITDACKLAAKKANVELFECDLNFHKK
ncbi:MAG: hypothetical protein QW270_05545 [Candidatus Bathyarchaeia archaeon]